MSKQPSTVVLVHGAWHGSWCWDRVVPLLEARGLTVRTVDLPSVGVAPGVAADLSGDAAAVAAVLDQVDGPALLCGHSYGGMVISVAAAGRSDVSRLVYLCAFMPDAGESLVQLTGGKPAPWIQLLDGGLTLPDPAQAVDVFYADCDGETAREAAARIRSMSGAAFGEPVAAPAWHGIPSTYVVCTLDRAIPPELQRDVFAPRADEVVELEASHSPFSSQPAAVAALLAERAL
jgi:pimeloyl-ACP methyl ester carboxylesterase